MRRVALTVLWMLGGGVGLSAGQAVEPPNPRLQALRAVRAVLESEAVEPRRFVADHLAPRLLQAEGEDSLMARLLEIRRAVAGEAPDDISREPGGIGLVYPRASGELRIHIRIDEDQAKVADLWIEDGVGLDSGADHSGPPPMKPFTWGNLEARMQEEAGEWFEGAVLVQRGGEVVFERAYGQANRERRAPNRSDTIFAIGSTPIDFTKAGILLLEERGRLSLADPIAKYFDGVPPDKQAMTLGHLFESRSGLQDFLGVPTDPPNPDHFYIDRDEAVRRILAHELRFDPGTGRAHSHAAWGLLAAVIEIVSGHTYQEFTRGELFGPAGMKDTGFFGEPLSEGRFAVGYGSMTEGEVNAPPYWGPTSWLVMGSGGMVSTLPDMLRWIRTLRAGQLLSPESLERYWSPPGAMLSGGDAFGFEIAYTEGPDDLVLVVSNAIDDARRRRWWQLARELARLVE